MKIGIISDTHGNRKAIDRVIKLVPDASLWLHAGDYTRDAEYLRKVSPVPVKMVAGNNDIFFGNKYPETEYFEFAGKNIWLTHGHRYRAKWGTRELLDEGLSLGADVVVFGHTHEPLIERHNNVLLINPGAATVWGGSFAVMTIGAKGDLNAEIIDLA